MRGNEYLQTKYLEKWKKAYDFSKKYMEKYTNYSYHNINHARDVAQTALKIATKEDMSSREKFLLITSAMFHDIVFKPEQKNNEEKSARLARYILPKLGYETKDVKEISHLILSTKKSIKTNKLEQTLFDADFDNLGRSDFFEKGGYVREELGIANNKAWYEQQLKLLKNHSYYTPTAERMRNQGLQKNISKLERIMEVLK